MDERKFQIIKELMEQLKSEMEPGADDLGERLGRPKVEIAVGAESPDMESDEDEMGMDMDGDMEMGPEDVLKKRLLKLRG